MAYFNRIFITLVSAFTEHCLNHHSNKSMKHIQRYDRKKLKEKVAQLEYRQLIKYPYLFDETK